MKTVYILGAGSSISHSNSIYPDIENIFIKAVELNILNDSSKKIKNQYIDLYKYIKSILGINILDTNKRLNFEKSFTLIEIENQKNTSEFGILRKQLIDILLNVFTKLKDNIDQSSELDHNIFAKKLNYEDTIISFNWDILLEDVLGRVVHLSPYLYGGKLEKSDQSKRDNYPEENLHNLSYFDFINSRYLRNYRESEYLNVRNSFYLKLHGSVDWKICRNQFCEKYNTPLPTLYPLKYKECDFCYENTDILIIPPILNKVINQSPLVRILWNIAVKEIIKTD